MAVDGYKNDMSLDERVEMAIVRTAERIKKESAIYLKKYNLTFSQYNVLRVLDASENGTNTMKNVNRIMLVSSANMTGITKRLEKMGLITRKNAPEDDRLKYLSMTPKGKAFVDGVADHKEAVVKKYLENLSNQEKIEFLKYLREILHTKF